MKELNIMEATVLTSPNPLTLICSKKEDGSTNLAPICFVSYLSFNPPMVWVRNEIREAKKLTDKPFGVNIMLMSPYADEVAKVVAEEGVKVVTTGAGNPEKYMELWKNAGIRVIPVVASVALARRMERAGADAVVAEGCESGGHIGETTTMALVPQVADCLLYTSPSPRDA